VAWTRRKKTIVLLASTIGAVAVVVTLLLLTFPVAEEQSGYTLIGFRLYSFESETVYGQAGSNYSFHEVTFEFHLWCGSITPGGAELCGNVTESSGARFAFSFFDGGLPGGSHPWLTWVAPDSNEAVEYESNSGGLAHLLVAT
jgi:hypothetical protein